MIHTANVSEGHMTLHLARCEGGEVRCLRANHAGGRIDVVYNRLVSAPEVWSRIGLEGMRPAWAAGDLVLEAYTLRDDAWRRDASQPSALTTLSARRLYEILDSLQFAEWRPIEPYARNLGGVDDVAVGDRDA